jgi:hypothetical protein
LDEFKQMLLALGLQYASAADVGGLFRKLDKDNSGDLEYAELVIMKDLAHIVSFMSDVGKSHEVTKKENNIGQGIQPFTSASIGPKVMLDLLNQKLLAIAKKSSANAVPSANVLKVSLIALCSRTKRSLPLACTRNFFATMMAQATALWICRSSRASSLSSACSMCLSPTLMDCSGVWTKTTAGAWNTQSW